MRLIGDGEEDSSKLIHWFKVFSAGWWLRYLARTAPPSSVERRVQIYQVTCPGFRSQERETKSGHRYKLQVEAAESEQDLIIMPY